MPATKRRLKVVKTGVITSEASVVDNMTQEEVYNKSDIVPVSQDVGVDGFIGLVEVAADVKMSQNFQSIGFKVGITLPWHLPQGDKGAIAKAFEFAHKVVEDQIAIKTQELQEALTQIGGRR